MRLFLYIALVFLPGLSFAQSVCDNVSAQFISRHLPLPDNAKIIKKQARGSVCEVILQTQNQVAPIYVGKDFVLIGQLLQNHESVTKETMEALSEVVKKNNEQFARQKAVQHEKKKSFLKKKLAELEQCVSIRFVPQGKIKDSVYFITDPGCPHCKNALEGLYKLAARTGILINIVIYPLLNENSHKLALEAICQDYSCEQYLNQKKIPQGSFACEKGTDRIERTNLLLQQAEIHSVPWIIGREAVWLVEGNRLAEARAYLGLDEDDMCGISAQKQIDCD